MCKPPLGAVGRYPFDSTDDCLIGNCVSEGIISRSFVDMRRRNALSILDVVRHQPGVSRADLSRAVNLSRATVSNIVDELIAIGMLEEIGAMNSIRGRKPIGLNFCPHSRYEAGVSIEDGKCRIAICDLDGNPTHRGAVNIGKQLNSDAAAKLAESVENLLQKAGGTKKRLGTLGLALPGPLQVDKPVLGETLPRPPKKYAGFAREMEKNLGVNVHICSNTRAAALAEARRGGLELDGWVIFVRLGQKVRCAVALDGRLVETESELGGDLGELCVPGNDFTCQCGKVGCINSVAAADAIINLCRERGLAVETTNQLIALVQSKDADARDIVRQAASAIGYGIATTINIFSPAAVVVSGPLVESGEAFWSVLDKSVRRYALAENLKRCEIRKANLWKEAEAIGASLFALSRDGLLPALIDTDRVTALSAPASVGEVIEPVDEEALD